MENTNETATGAGRPADWDHPRRCTANKSDGSGRCGHYALRGTNVCKFHGGAAPQVRRAIAARRMNDLYGPMFAKLAQCLESGDLDAILKACAIISRHHLADTEAGRLPPSQMTNAPALDVQRWSEFLTTDELMELDEVMKRYEALAKERMDAGIEPRTLDREQRHLGLPGDVIDVTPSGGGREPRASDEMSAAAVPSDQLLPLGHRCIRNQIRT